MNLATTTATTPIHSPKQTANSANSRRAPRVTDAFAFPKTGVIGTGASGSVRLATDRATGVIRAIKVVPKSVSNSASKVRREVGFLSMLADVPGVVDMHAFYESGNHYYMALDYLRGGDMYARLQTRGALDEHSARAVFGQLLATVAEMHARTVVHRDLKLSNVVLRDADSLDVALVDFGLAAAQAQGVALHDKCGTPGYVAPEVLDSSRATGGYSGFEADMWQLGVLLYELLCGFPPFYANDLNTMFELVRHQPVAFVAPFWDHVSAEARDLVLGLLNRDVNARLTAVQAMQHAWFAAGQ